MENSKEKKNKYSILIVEDDKDQLNLVKNQIKKSCSNEIWLTIFEAEYGNRAKEILTSNVIPFLSLDQLIQMDKDGPFSSKHGIEILNYAFTFQPFRIANVFTNHHPEWTANHSIFTGEGVNYYSKEVGMDNYGKIFIESIRKFEKEEAWKLGSEILPPLFSEFCLRIISNLDEHPYLSLKNITNLWEAFIRLFSFMNLCILDYFDENISNYLINKNSRLDNHDFIQIIFSSKEQIINVLKKNDFFTQQSEISRFLYSENTENSINSIISLRNLFAHDPVEKSSNMFSENLSSFINLLFGCSFWNLHPLATDIKVITWGNRYAFEGQPLIGQHRYIEKRKWNWDSKIVVKNDQIYQILSEPLENERALIIPLYPLIRLEFGDKNVVFWFAHEPEKNRYRDPVSGEKKDFHDNDLSQWWKKRVAQSINSNFNEGTSQPLNGKGKVIDTPNNIKNLLSNFLKNYYSFNENTAFNEADEQYQLTFSGKKKAIEVLEYLSSIRNINYSKMVYVSIGGADGSEIEHILLETNIEYGIVIEYSDYGAKMAQQRSENLKSKGKNLYVLHGDVMMRLKDCKSKLNEWKKDFGLEGVILSFQAILHELPTRSPKFDPNILFADIFNPFDVRIFYSKEPTFANDWPKIVHIKSEKVSGKNLYNIARQINDALKFDTEVNELADDFIQIESNLCTEMLYKILYCKDISRYKYEMEEKLTSFDPENYSKILRNYIQPVENIDINYMASDTFKNCYKQYKIIARNATNVNLGIPKTSVVLTGYQGL